MAPADRRDPRGRRADVLIAVGTAVVAVGLVLGVPPLDDLDPDSGAAALMAPAVLGPAWTILVVSLLVQSAMLLGARRAPRTTLLAVAAVPVVTAASSWSGLFGVTALPVVVAVVLTAFRVPLPRLWPAVVGAAALVGTSSAITFGAGSGAFRSGLATGLSASAGHGVLQAVGAVGLPLVIALVVRSRRELRAARTAESDARAAESDAQTAAADARVDAAVARERTAMARELHDIAAHHLSGIALMSAVVDRQIDTDPEGAHAGVREVRAQSTAVLEDLRRLVGLLRDDGPAGRAVESLAGVADLVESARARIDVTLDVRDGPRGAGDGVGPLAQLVAYRTVQEALANVTMHAPGATTTVVLDDSERAHLTVRVRNTAATAPAADGSAAGGNGLCGMHERAALVGAALRTGPTDDGGWLVELVLGREAPTAPDASAGFGTATPSDPGVTG